MVGGDQPKTMNHKRLRKLFLLLTFFLFCVYQLASVHTKYGKLFYVETYLPEPNFPLQHPKERSNPTQQLPRDRPNTSTLLCLIVTSPQYHETRAVHAAATWARHCDRAVFVTSEADPSLADSCVVPAASGYYDLWQKVSKGFNWVYDQDLLSTYDWVLKVDDDTFVFVDNLVQALAPYDPNQAMAAGHKLLTWDTHEVYLNGGAGYVLSKAAVRKLVSKGLKAKVCETDLLLGTGEDVNMALCLSYLGVSLMDFRDSDEKRQFSIYPPQQEIDPRQGYVWSHLWLKLISVHPYPFGLDGLSHQPISFHYVDAETMYLVYYLVYVVNAERREQYDNDIRNK